MYSTFSLLKCCILHLQKNTRYRWGIIWSSEGRTQKHIHSVFSAACFNYCDQEMHFYPNLPAWGREGLTFHKVEIKLLLSDNSNSSCMKLRYLKLPSQNFPWLPTVGTTQINNSYSLIFCLEFISSTQNWALNKAFLSQKNNAKWIKARWLSIWLHVWNTFTDLSSVKNKPLEMTQDTVS